MLPLADKVILEGSDGKTQATIDDFQRQSPGGLGAATGIGDVLNIGDGRKKDTQKVALEKVGMEDIIPAAQNKKLLKASTLTDA